LIAAGTADDAGKLAASELYVKTEKSGKLFKLATPICLSFHPPNPPTPEEVIARARRSAAVVWRHRVLNEFWLLQTTFSQLQPALGRAD
jgi:hypothetical protein